MKNSNKIKYKLTILTPTYNRKKYLSKLYESLLNQTNKDFQWLIIDDGSTDDTKKEVKSFSQASFAIDYIYKKNGGKHTAINFSHQYIKGEWTCIVDSDDYLSEDAVQTIIEYIKKYESDNNIMCFTFLRGNDKGIPLNSDFPETPVISNIIQFRYNEKRKGDCCEVLNTSVLKSITFPEHTNEKFLGEGYLWCRVGFNYDTVFINKVIYICSYLEGGLTKSGRKMRMRNPLGGMDNCNSFFLKGNNRHVKQSLLLKEAMLFVCYGKFAGLTRKQIIEKSFQPCYIKKYYLLGVLLYLYYKKRYK